MSNFIFLHALDNYTSSPFAVRLIALAQKTKEVYRRLKSETAETSSRLSKISGLLCVSFSPATFPYIQYNYFSSTVILAIWLFTQPDS